MANLMLNSFRNLSVISRNNVKKISSIFSLNSSRNLYTAESLGTDTFIQQQEQIRKQMHNIEEKFREKMNGYAGDDSKNMIFTEDLKNMVHLAKSDADFDLIIKMMKKFNQQNKQLRFGNFVFGPVVMRLFHINNKADLALECFNSPELTGFFDQLISYQLLMDLLYENKKYEEMLKTFENITERQLNQMKYPKNIVVLALAACYKMNSKHSLDYALKLWGQLAEVGHIPMRRASTFCAGLALRQGKPEVALEILSTVKNQNYTTVRNIRVAALAAVGRADDALPILKSILAEDVPTTTKHTFNRDVFNDVKRAADKLNNPDITLELNRIENLFEKEGHITEMTLDEQLCTEIQKPPLNNRQTNRYSRFDQSNNSNNYSQDRNRRNFKSMGYRPRPGLEDMA